MHAVLLLILIQMLGLILLIHSMVHACMCARRVKVWCGSSTLCSLHAEVLHAHHISLTLCA